MRGNLGWVLAALPLVVSASVREIVNPPEYVRGETNLRPVHPIDAASWIWAPGTVRWGVESAVQAWGVRNEMGESPADMFRFRCRFEFTGEPLRIAVSADERYVLYLDGQPVARGPVRGMVEHWYYHTYEFSGLTAGEHWLEAVVWQLGVNAPLAQLSHRGGLVLRASGDYDEQLTTGKGAWQVARLKNTTFIGRGTSKTFGVGSQCRVQGTSFANEVPDLFAWQPAAVVRGPVKETPYGARTSGWMLYPADRPEMKYELKAPGRFKAAKTGENDGYYAAADRDSSWVAEFNRLLAGEAVTVPPHTRLRLAWDLEDYYCAYPELRLAGGRGAKISWGWAESLWETDNGEGHPKGNRGEFVGKAFVYKFADEFVSDGRAEAHFTAPWWRCGRWCELEIVTEDEPLTLKSLLLGETGYPMTADAAFECEDAELMQIGRLSERTLRGCVHEMTFDCPYYEQQMYPGDSRIQLEILNAFTRDTRMQRYVMSVFDFDRRSDGMVAMNFPTRGTQECPTYTMCWLMMFKDYLAWQGDRDFLKLRLPGAHAALSGLALYENEDGLLADLPGWPFMDWVQGEYRFPGGVAIDGKRGVSALNNLQYLLALQSIAAVDRWLEEPELAAYCERRAERLAQALKAKFMDDRRGILADTLGHDRFSEHAQAMAILAGILSPEERERALAALEHRSELAPASTYFAYYLFRAFARCGRADLIRRHLDYWRTFLKLGAKTAFETQSVHARSDCHAWSACPLYVYQTVFAGVTPAMPGFRKARIAPQPAGLKWLRAKTPTPLGMIETDFRFDGGRAVGTIRLPRGMSGKFEYGGQVRYLASGLTVIGEEPAAAKAFNVRDYGAVGDGRAKDTAAIQAAVDAAAAAGGGEVLLPAGTYLSGSIYLKDNIDFHLAEGATLYASPDPKDYNPTNVCPQNWSSVSECASGAHLLLAIEKRNIRVRGPGRFYGNMPAFNLNAEGQLWPPTKAPWTLGIPWRPSQLLYFVESQGLRLENFEIADAPYWSCFLHGCERVDISRLVIHNLRNPRTHNGDGIDIDSCREVRVGECDICVTDDAITFRASNARLKRPGDCAYNVVSNCTLSSLCQAFRLGVGEGRVHDIEVRDIVIYNSRRAVNFVSSWNRSSSGVAFDKVRFTNLEVDALDFCKLYPFYAPTSSISRVTFENVTGRVRHPSYVVSRPHCPYRDIVFRNVWLEHGVESVEAELKFEGGTLSPVVLSEAMRNRMREEIRQHRYPRRPISCPYPEFNF